MSTRSPEEQERNFWHEEAIQEDQARGVDETPTQHEGGPKSLVAVTLAFLIVIIVIYTVIILVYK